MLNAAQSLSRWFSVSDELHKAAANGDLTKLQALVGNGVNLNLLYQGETPLHIAIMHNQTQAAAYLLSVGANVNAVNSHQSTPLQLAIRHTNLPLIPLIVKTYQANIHLAPLIQEIFCARPIDLNILQYLLKHPGVLANTDNIDQLKAACYRYNIFGEIIVQEHEGLFDLLTPMPALQIFINTDLLNFAYYHGRERFKESIKRVLLLKNYHYNGLYAHECIQEELPAALKTLRSEMILDKNLSIQDVYQQLDTAIFTNDKTMLDKAIITLYEKGHHPFHDAVNWGNIQTVKALVQTHYFNINATVDGRTPLHNAAARADSEMVGFLVAQGANVNARIIDPFQYKCTPLHLAAANCHRNEHDVLQTVKILLANGANINAINDERNTPYQCAEQGYKVISNYLRQQGVTENHDTPKYSGSKGTLTYVNGLWTYIPNPPTGNPSDNDALCEKSRKHSTSSTGSSSSFSSIDSSFSISSYSSSASTYSSSTDSSSSLTTHQSIASAVLNQSDQVYVPQSKSFKKHREELARLRQEPIKQIQLK